MAEIRRHAQAGTGSPSVNPSVYVE